MSVQTGRKALWGAIYHVGRSACERFLLADAGFILPPQLYLDAGCSPRIFVRFGGEVFFKSLGPARFAT